MTMCIILNDTDRQVVESGVDSGELFTSYGTTKGYLDGNELHPARRANDAQGNARYILSTRVMTVANDAGDQLVFGTAVPYLSGLPQMDSTDPNFPGLYVPPAG